jgi:hypothetical protein
MRHILRHRATRYPLVPQFRCDNTSPERRKFYLQSDPQLSDTPLSVDARLILPYRSFPLERLDAFLLGFLPQLPQPVRAGFFLEERHNHEEH